MTPDEYRRMFQAEDRHWWYRALRRLWIQERDNRKAAAIASVLDIGCGTGANLAQLHPNLRRVGVDFVSEALQFTRSRGIAALAQADAVALPFADASFDAALMLDVLYHAAVLDKLAALREARRILRPEGTLYVNVPAYAWLRSAHDRAVHTSMRFTARQLRTMLVDAGFEPLRITYWNTLLFPPIALVRLSGKRRQARSDLESQPSTLANAVFGGVLAVERAMLHVMNMPFGVSVFATAKRPPNA